MWLKTQLPLGTTLAAAAACVCKNVSGESRYSVLARAIAGTAGNNFVITRPVALWGRLGAVIAGMILHSRRGFPGVSLLPVVAGGRRNCGKWRIPSCVSHDGLFARENARVFRSVYHCAFAFLSRIRCSLCLPESSEVHFHVSIILSFPPYVRFTLHDVFLELTFLISLMEKYGRIEGVRVFLTRKLSPIVSFRGHLVNELMVASNLFNRDRQRTGKNKPWQLAVKMWRYNIFQAFARRVLIT